jgi:hypothetical protein
MRTGRIHIPVTKLAVLAWRKKFVWSHAGSGTCLWYGYGCVLRPGAKDPGTDGQVRFEQLPVPPPPIEHVVHVVFEGRPARRLGPGCAPPHRHIRHVRVSRGAV